MSQQGNENSGTKMPMELNNFWNQKIYIQVTFAVLKKVVLFDELWKFIL